MNLYDGKKSTTDNLILKSKFAEILDTYDRFNAVYTDGSKDGDRVAAAAVADRKGIAFRLPSHASIFSAELKAILVALDCMKVSTKKQFILFSDSLSALQAIRNHKLDNTLVMQIILRYNKLLSLGKNMGFCWVPSHAGIHGNEKADKMAKEAL